MRKALAHRAFVLAATLEWWQEAGEAHAIACAYDAPLRTIERMARIVAVLDRLSAALNE